MTEIELLEAEIAEKQAILKQMKALENPTFTYRPITDALKEDYDNVFISEVTNAIRILCLTASRVHERTHDGRVTIASYVGKGQRVKDLAADSIHVCNAMIAEIAPTLVMYIKHFASMNSGGSE